MLGERRLEGIRATTGRGRMRIERPKKEGRGGGGEGKKRRKEENKRVPLFISRRPAARSPPPAKRAEKKTHRSHGILAITSPFEMGTALVSSETNSPRGDDVSPGFSRPIRNDGWIAPSGWELIHYLGTVVI